MLKRALLLFLFALSTLCFAQNQDQAQASTGPDPVAAALAAAGCGSSATQWSVDVDKQQHPMPQPAPGQALIYVFETDNLNGAIIRVGLDSKWVAANRSGTYLFFPADPGEHRLCVNVQSSQAAPPGIALTIVTEPGKTYYVEVQMDGSPGVIEPIQIQGLDDAQGHYLIATHYLSMSSLFKPKKNQTQPEDPLYNH